MVNAEFNWWLLIVGLIVGAGLTWLVLADLRRGEDEVESAELRPEAGWIAERLAAAARPLSVEAVEAVLRAHRDYLRLAPEELDGVLAAASPAVEGQVVDGTRAAAPQGPGTMTGGPGPTTLGPGPTPAPRDASPEPVEPAIDQPRGGTRPT